MIIFQGQLDRPYVTKSVDLDGTRYFVTYRKSFRYDRISLDILDAQGNMIVSGIKLVAGDDLLKPYSDERLPPGRLRLAASPGDPPPTLETLGVTAWLVYITAAEAEIVDDFEVAVTPRPQVAGIS